MGIWSKVFGKPVKAKELKVEVLGEDALERLLSE